MKKITSSLVDSGMNRLGNICGLDFKQGVCFLLFDTLKQVF